MQKLYSMFVLGIFLITSFGCSMVQNNQFSQIQTKRTAMLLEELTRENLRAVHMGGNWGTNRDAVYELPVDYFEFLHSLNVNWVGISVALYVDGSMDSNVQRMYSGVDVLTFTDEVLARTIRTFHQHGLNVYLNLAFESLDGNQKYPLERWQLGDLYAQGWNNDRKHMLPEFWPWNPNHPDHENFVSKFWRTYTEQAVHFGKIAESEGVKLYSLGTETERLFRSRSNRNNRRSRLSSSRWRGWPNDFGAELKNMVRAVREVYSGLLTYDMDYNAILNPDGFFGPGSNHLWEDMNLDVVGISAYFPLVDRPPLKVPTVKELEKRWERIFRKYLYPLQARNPKRPILSLEFGYVDSTASPFAPASEVGKRRSFWDADGNGMDDGEETQANIYQAFFNTIDRHPGLIRGAFLWGIMIASEEVYSDYFRMRGFNVRRKLAEHVVRQRYGAWQDM